ncbi:hypothetical protein R55210_AODCCCNP_01397 [Fructobacillus fructosus]|uniref:alkaline shock response membrane anchor protein AmaP n=1 Tax=Fructobacillus fructosus TaxID=1631 RepID=UPI002D87087B|nr:hypothetical protein R55210_AODCCCNP_01397 [Fructobacillus fructosus]
MNKSKKLLVTTYLLLSTFFPIAWLLKLHKNLPLVENIYSNTLFKDFDLNIFIIWLCFIIILINFLCLLVVSLLRGSKKYIIFNTESGVLKIDVNSIKSTVLAISRDYKFLDITKIKVSMTRKKMNIKVYGNYNPVVSLPIEIDEFQKNIHDDLKNYLHDNHKHILVLVNLKHLVPNQKKKNKKLA